MVVDNVFYCFLRIYVEQLMVYVWWPALETVAARRPTVNFI